MRVRDGALREYLRGALWVLPALSAAISLGVGALLSAIDVAKESPLGRLSYQGNAGDARQLLTVVAATMITVIALLFSLTVVALQISSTQYSPRLLRNFLRDRPVQLVLSIFVSTFAYCTAGLYTVGIERHGQEFVPRVAISGALLLGFASLGMLVYYIHHVAHSIQIDSIMESVQLQTLGVIADGHVTLHATNPADVVAPPPDAAPETLVTARRPGYVQSVNVPALAALATRAGLSIRVPFRAGQHVNRGTVVAALWRRIPEGTPCVRAVTDTIRDAVRVGVERTLEQDVRFGIRQLVDIASKALSPAINDPYTAVQAVDRLSVLLCELARRQAGDHAQFDNEGRLLVAAARPPFGAYLELACGQIRRYGSAEPMVLAALVRLLTDAGNSTPSAERRRQVGRQVGFLIDTLEAARLLPVDRLTVRTMAAEALGCFEQGVRTPGPADRPRSTSWDFASWRSAPTRGDTPAG